jgi:hypothetical protein
MSLYYLLGSIDVIEQQNEMALARLHSFDRVPDLTGISR